ncbi:hypothetical protein EMPG_10935 [Blastomyces silverae]|uniref:Uncharacterized protein n=1 Tax=Blastomyces silverae TaxID=2060906 RepID=A0A0H1B2I5_9EURO|nr:hypothetical protein EMPG_10935 [Blastomyces silverae]
MSATSTRTGMTGCGETPQSAPLPSLPPCWSSRNRSTMDLLSRSICARSQWL